MGLRNATVIPESTNSEWIDLGFLKNIRLNRTWTYKFTSMCMVTFKTGILFLLVPRQSDKLTKPLSLNAEPIYSSLPLFRESKALEQLFSFRIPNNLQSFRFQKQCGNRIFFISISPSRLVSTSLPIHISVIACAVYKSRINRVDLTWMFPARIPFTVCFLTNTFIPFTTNHFVIKKLVNETWWIMKWRPKCC